MGMYGCGFGDLIGRFFDVWGEVDPVGVDIAVDELPGVGEVPVLQSE